MIYDDIMPARSPDLLVPLLASRSPVTLEQLQHALGNVSARTTFRSLGRPPPGTANPEARAAILVVATGHSSRR